MYEYEFEQIGHSSDTVVFYCSTATLLSRKYYKKDFQVLLLRRAQEPCKHLWCIPGGFTESHETLADGAIRETREETGLVLDNVMFVSNYDSLLRAGKRRVIASCFTTVFTQKPEVTVDNDEISGYKWVNVDTVGKHKLAFDHTQMVKDAYASICKTVQT
jgi:8-oxo-dGTP diphosphatase